MEGTSLTELILVLIRCRLGTAGSEEFDHNLCPWFSNLIYNGMTEAARLA